jgi:glycosyltransferase involved in cell wall biosynthesis
MRDIKTFEAFLLTGESANHHIRRKNEVMLSLPASREGAMHSLKLYQPQKRLARMKAWVIGQLVERGLHPWILADSKLVSGEFAKGWSFSYSPETVGILLGSPEHRVERAIASYLGADGWEVAKLGVGPKARSILLHEAEILSVLASRGLNAPRCLGLHEQGDMTLLRMPYLAGRSLNHDDTSGAMDLLFKWIDDAPRKAIDQFEEWKPIRKALESITGGQAVLEALSGYLLKPVIAHGDFARWNLLRQADGRIIAIDWEWGVIGGMPGLDLAHYFSQDARLVRQLSTRDAMRVIEAELQSPRAMEYLMQTGWGKSPIEPILVCAAFKQGSGHQKNWRFLDACVKEYLARHLENSPRSGNVGRSSPRDFAAARSTASTPEAELGKTGPLISIATPSFKQVDFLKCCAASVRDQEGDFRVEHLIQDGSSGPEFTQWAASQAHADWVSEPDSGMYDAINRSFQRATGDIIAWLNCDEQYLPDALQQVARFFKDHPEIDILFGDVILVDEKMTPLAYRRAVMPTVQHIRHSHLSTFSAATFVRRRVLDEGHFLDTRWQTIADAVWIERLLTAGYRAATLGKPLAAFCMLGSNLGQSELLFKERHQWEQELGTTNQFQKRYHIAAYRLQRLIMGAYLPRKVEVHAHRLGAQHRSTHEKWVSGQWSVAVNDAADLRSQRDGSLGGLMIQIRPLRWVLIHAVWFSSMAIALDKITAGDAVKGPFILLFSLLFLSFRSRFQHLIPVVILYCLTSLYLLSERPTDIMAVRTGTFILGAILSIFWSASLRNMESWVQSTVSLIRKLPEPIILTSSSGKIILVNQSASNLLEIDEEALMDHQLFPLALGDDDRVTERLNIDHWGEKPPDRPVGLALEEGESYPVKSMVFMVGKGRYRFYVFTLNPLPDRDLSN